MNFKDIEGMSITDLGSILTKTQTEVDRVMGELSHEDRIKVDNIVKGVDTKDNKSMGDYLKKQKDANRD